MISNRPGLTGGALLNKDGMAPPAVTVKAKRGQARSLEPAKEHSAELPPAQGNPVKEGVCHRVLAMPSLGAAERHEDHYCVGLVGYCVGLVGLVG